MNGLRILLLLLIANVAMAATPCEDVVCVEVESTPAALTFFANSRADGVTIHFSVVVIGRNLPPVVTKTVQRGRTEMLTVEKIKGKEPKYEHAFFWEWGVLGATHDDGISYLLPFEAGKTFRVYQGPNGALSHDGTVAFDFTMPVGTPVRAARGGTVTSVVDEFGEGGTDVNFMDKANLITILHDDGMLADYAHLLRGAMRVKQGDCVDAGAIIAASGNSGWSTGPHLHFQVWRRMDSAPMETLPVKFLVGDKHGVVLEEGKSYRAE